MFSRGIYLAAGNQSSIHALSENKHRVTIRQFAVSGDHSNKVNTGEIGPRALLTHSYGTVSKYEYLHEVLALGALGWGWRVPSLLEKINTFSIGMNMR